MKITFYTQTTDSPLTFMTYVQFEFPNSTSAAAVLVTLNNLIEEEANLKSTAELIAIQHFLLHSGYFCPLRDMVSQLTVSTGQVKKALQQKNLIPQANQLAAPITMQIGKTSIRVKNQPEYWVLKCEPNKVKCITVSGLYFNTHIPVKTRFGPIRVSSHAVQKFSNRFVGSTTHPFKQLVAMLQEPLKAIELPEHVKEHKANKYDTPAEFWSNDQIPWVFVVAKNPNSPVLVTCFQKSGGN